LTGKAQRAHALCSHSVTLGPSEARKPGVQLDLGPLVLDGARSKWVPGSGLAAGPRTTGWRVPGSGLRRPQDDGVAGPGFALRWAKRSVSTRGALRELGPSDSGRGELPRMAALWGSTSLILGSSALDGARSKWVPGS